MHSADIYPVFVEIGSELTRGRRQRTTSARRRKNKTLPMTFSTSRTKARLTEADGEFRARNNVLNVSRFVDNRTDSFSETFRWSFDVHLTRIFRCSGERARSFGETETRDFHNRRKRYWRTDIIYIRVTYIIRIRITIIHSQRKLLTNKYRL